MLTPYVREFAWMSEIQQAKTFAALFLVLLVLTASAAVLSRITGRLLAVRRRSILGAISDAWVNTYSQGAVIEPHLWASFPPDLVVAELASVRRALTDEEDLKLITQASQASRVQRWIFWRARSRFWWVRAMAAEHVGAFGAEGRVTAGMLKQLITDRVDSVRVRAIRGMGRQRLHVPLCNIINEFDCASREDALIAADSVLSGARYDGAFMADWPLVVATAQGRELALRCIAMQGLTPDIGTYEKAVADKDSMVRAAAALCAQTFYSDEPLGSLRKLAEGDKDPRVRDIAIRELASISGRAALPEIERALRNEPSHLVQLGAAEAACRVLSGPEEALGMFGFSPAVRHVVDLWRLGIFTKIG